MGSRLAVAALALAGGVAATSCLLPPIPCGPTDPTHDEVSTSLPFTGDKFTWPPGKRAAVSLTYDDALNSQLNNAAPVLRKHHLRATFFVTDTARTSPDRWKDLLHDGHELASHTMKHPCEAAQSWVQKGNALEDYDLARMQAELEESIVFLRTLGVKHGPYSFAYPCGSTWVGKNHDSYTPLTKRLFAASRGVGAQPINPSTEAFENTPAVSGDKSAAELIELVEANAQRAGWLVIMFHGVGGDHLAVSTEAHDALLEYLDQHRSSVWVDTYLKVSTYVGTHRPPLSTSQAE